MFDNSSYYYKFAKCFVIALGLLHNYCLAQNSKDYNINEIACEDDALPCDLEGCIEKGRWCDTVIDCSDSSDEMYCANSWSPRPKCLVHHFQCADGTCIPLNGRCDGFPDCKDRSDEICPGRSDEKLNPLKLDPKDIYFSDSDERNVISSQIDEALKKGADWMMSKCHDVFGVDKARAMVALLLTNKNTFAAKEWERELLVKQLDLQLMLDLMKNESKPSSLAVLSLYVNAIVASCQDPRNFHGLDLRRELRQRSDAVLKSGSSLTPITLLTLCIVGEFTDEDVSYLYDIIYGGSWLQKPDFQSLAVMALACMSRDNRYKAFEDVAKNAVKMIIQHLDQHGAADVYTSALVAQAFISTLSDADEWDKSSLRSLLSWQKSDGSFGDVLSTYYALPVLAGKSLISLKESSCFKSGPLPALKYSGGREINIHYSLWLNSPPEEVHTLKLKIPFNTSFFDVMRLAGEENQLFRYKSESSSGSRSVYSIANIPNDAERGYYWTLHVQTANLHSSEEQEENIPVYQGGLENLYPRNGNHLIFWFKNMLPEE